MKFNFNQKGSALIVVILLMGIILSLSLYYLSFSMTEKKISDSQFKGASTYYLAEAGVQEMIWRLKNNETYKDNFEEDSGWSVEFSRDNPFGGGSGSYSVSLQNIGLAEGNIVSTGTISTLSGSQSRRVIKTTVYKATASSSRVDGYSMFSDNDIDISLAEAQAPTSSIHANNDIFIFGSLVDIDENLEAVNRYDKPGSTVNVGGETMSVNQDPPGAEDIEMPSVSFADESDPESFINKADAVYTEEEFENLVDAGGTVTLNNEITYVEGEIEVDKEIELIINGLLVANGDIEMGGSCGKDHTLVVTSTPPSPSGLIANGKIRFNHCFDDANVYGVIYATKDVVITNFHGDMKFEGGMYGRNIEIFSIWQNNNLIFNKDIVHNSLNVSEFSPVVTVEHWEEEY